LKDEEEGDESEGRSKGLHLEEEEEPKTTPTLFMWYLQLVQNVKAISKLHSGCRNNK
jgi:hypothetical protein